MKQYVSVPWISVTGILSIALCNNSHDVNNCLTLFWASIRAATAVVHARRLFSSEFRDLRLFALLCGHNKLG